MANGIRPVPRIIVVVKTIMIMDYYCIAMVSITMMVIVGMTPYIDANCHGGKCRIVRRIVTIIIGWVIGNIGRGVYILHNRC